jgi:DNA-nicking Smr family endonuclease
VVVVMHASRSTTAAGSPGPWAIRPSGCRASVGQRGEPDLGEPPELERNPTAEPRPDTATATARSRTMGGVKLKLDLHDIYNKGEEIDRALRAIIDEAVAKKAPLVEIIPGKGSGQLKKRVLRFLDQKEIRALYHRVEKDRDNFGRIFVHFRWK